MFKGNFANFSVSETLDTAVKAVQTDANSSNVKINVTKAG
jgi:hypothetical protein